MITIHKYDLDFYGCDVPMKFLWPKGTKVLKAGVQYRQVANSQKPAPFICLWVEFDDLVLDSETRSFVIHGTGHEITEDGRVYLETVFVDLYVWHIYELKEQS